MPESFGSFAAASSCLRSSGAELASDHGERVVDFLAGVGSVIDRKIENGFARRAPLRSPAPCVRSETPPTASISSTLCSGLARSTAVALAPCSAWPSTVSTQILIEEIFRGELEALGVAAFPGGRAQVAGRYLALAGIELRDLAEFQRVALAGIAVEIVEDAAAHRGDLRRVARPAERKLVDGAVGDERDRASSAACAAKGVPANASVSARKAPGRRKGVRWGHEAEHEAELDLVSFEGIPGWLRLRKSYAILSSGWRSG